MTCHFLIYNLAVYTHKIEFQKGIKFTEKTEKIEISLSDLNKDTKQIEWLGVSEIKYNNEFFDIVSVKKENGKAILSVVNDRIEKEMNEEYQEQSDIIFEKNQNTNKGHQLISGFLSLKCICTDVLDFSMQVSEDSFLKEISFPVCFGYLTVQTPPPNKLV